MNNFCIVPTQRKMQIEFFLSWFVIGRQHLYSTCTAYIRVIKHKQITARSLCNCYDTSVAILTNACCQKEHFLNQRTVLSDSVQPNLLMQGIHFKPGFDVCLFVSFFKAEAGSLVSSAVENSMWNCFAWMSKNRKIKNDVFIVSDNIKWFMKLGELFVLG